MLVEFHCAEKCQSIVLGWFREWPKVRRMLDNDENVDDNDTACKDASFECLRDLFAGNKGATELEEFLSSANSAEGRAIIQQLEKWTYEIHSQFVEPGQQSLELASNTHQDMREQLRPFRGRAQDATFRQKIGFQPIATGLNHQVSPIQRHTQGWKLHYRYTRRREHQLSSHGDFKSLSANLQSHHCR